MLFAVGGFAKNYAYLSLSLFIAGIARNKVTGLKAYLHLADQNKRLEETNEELAKLNALKDRLLSIVSHDIRAPLYSLKSLLTLLVNKNISAKELQDVLGILNHQVDQLTHFLENLLRWTKNHYDQIKPNPEHLPLQNLVQETIELLSPLAYRKQVNISFDVSENVTVYADVEMIKFVLRNLVSNAIKFCKAYDNIHIKAEEAPDTIRVSVRDTGLGMSEENLRKLFILSSLSTKGTKDEIGTGLGLAICHEFIEKLNGTIQATSKEGEGSCFEFTVPRTRPSHGPQVQARQTSNVTKF